MCEGSTSPLTDCSNPSLSSSACSPLKRYVPARVRRMRSMFPLSEYHSLFLTYCGTNTPPKMPRFDMLFYYSSRIRHPSSMYNKPFAHSRQELLSTTFRQSLLVDLFNQFLHWLTRLYRPTSDSRYRECCLRSGTRLAKLLCIT